MTPDLKSTQSNVSITTLGGFDAETGRGAYGLYNGPFGESESGGVAKLTNSTIATSGDQMFAAVTLAGGSTTISGGSLTTSGLGASGVVTEGGGFTSVNGASVSTTGQDAHALFVTGSGSQANLGGTNTFATQGDGAIGLYATLGGVVSATGSVTITTGRRRLPGDGPRRLWRQRRRRGLADQARLGDHHDLRRRRDRAVCERRRLERRRRLDHGRRNARSENNKRGGGCDRAAGQWRFHSRDRRRIDHLGG